MPKGSRLSIALLGPPLVDVDGEPLRVDTRKATALLTYLTVTGRAARRDTLTGLLWPETAPDRARATLRRTLSTLRSALGDRWLEVDGDTITLDRTGVELDIASFRACIAAGGHDDLTAAVALHRGDFLEGFGLRDSAAFDDWQQLESDTLRRELADALDRLADSYALRRETTAAIGCARRRLALDPLHEPAYRQLIGLLAAAGDRQGAMERYRDCVRVLDRELGVRPLDETTALYHAVVEGTFTPEPGEASVPAVQQRDASHDLVGRDRELGAALAAFDGVGPDGRLLALVGEAGIGKTRLGAELLHRVGQGGHMAVAVRCYEEEQGLAYGVALDLVRGALAYAGDPPPDAWWVAEVARLLPELGSAPPQPVDSPAAQLRLYEAVAELLVHCAGSKAALFVDDAHWADESSLGLLGYLVHRLAGRPLLVVVSWRSEDVAQNHPVRGLLAEAQRQSRATIVTLRRLGGADVSALVEATGRDGSLGTRLYRESGGLPFFVVEYLDGLARGDDAGDEWSVPVGVRDLLERRLASLGELADQVVAAAAVLGSSFDADTVRAASGRGDDETVTALEELVARGMLVEGAEGAFDFRHEQARTLVYERMTLARRRLLHRRAAVELNGRGRRDTLAPLIAHHLAAAGDDDAAAARYRTAGDEARRLYANTEALAHYRAALALGHEDAAGLHEAIGDLETLVGDYGAAFASYEAAAALSSPERVPEVEHRLGLLHLRRGEWELADASLARAAEGLDPATRALVLADRSLAAHRLGRDDDAERLASGALRLAADVDDGRALAQARNVTGMLAAARGDLVTAVTELERAVELAQAAGDPGQQAAALNNLALAVGRSGDVGRATTLLEEALATCRRTGDRHRVAAIRNNLADALRAAGRDDEAMAELKEAVALFAEVGEVGRLEPEIWKLSEW